MEKRFKYLKRFYELIGEKEKFEQYLIKITFPTGVVSESLNEHKVFQNFLNSSNRYNYHPETTNPPVKAHYHIYPLNSKQELYAVNVDDGKAHHKKNRGIIVPHKEADELRKLGVKLPDNNILETKSISEIYNIQILNERINEDNIIYLIFPL